MDGSELKNAKKMIPLDRLDVLLKVVEVKGWFILLFFILLAVAVILWSLMGNISITLSGKCIAFDPDTSFRLRSEISGFVQKINVKAGDAIAKGQVLATLESPELYWKLKNQVLLVASLEKEVENLKANPRLLSQKQNELEDQRKYLDSLRENEKNLQIVSPVDAAISWVDAVQGDRVEPDEVLFWIHFPAAPENLKILAFVPLFSGQQIVPGMKALTSLHTVDTEKYGMIQGIVKQVAPYPISSSDYYMQLIPSLPLREYLVGEDNPSLLVIIDPLLDPKTFSHLKWTSQSGPPCTIQPGIIGETRIVLDKVKPFSFLFPLARDKKKCSL